MALVLPEKEYDPLFGKSLFSLLPGLLFVVRGGRIEEVRLGSSAAVSDVTDGVGPISTANDSVKEATGTLLLSVD